jgi:tripartite-type tricarboxylate transporter receptor subunit TctC
MTLIRTAFIVLALFAAGHAQAQTYPDRTIRILVGFTPGSATDITARMFAQKLSEAWNVPVTVENLPGAGGSVGGERVARAAPDGYTLYWGANGALAINPSLLPSVTFDPERDLAPIARLLTATTILAVNNDVPVKNVAELIAFAKSQPGKLSYASPGTGTPQHMGGEVFKRMAGVDIVHVPYRGANFTDVIGGRITMTFQNAGAVLATVRDGKLRGLAITSAQRSPNIPELPTVAESGVPGFEVSSWFALMAPAGTPPAIVAKLHQEAVKIVAQQDLREKFAQIGLDVIGNVEAPEVFARFMRDDIARWAKIIKDTGIKAGD